MLCSKFLLSEECALLLGHDFQLFLVIYDVLVSGADDLCGRFRCKWHFNRLFCTRSSITRSNSTIKINYCGSPGSDDGWQRRKIRSACDQAVINSVGHGVERSMCCAEWLRCVEHDWGEIWPQKPLFPSNWTENCAEARRQESWREKNKAKLNEVWYHLFLMTLNHIKLSSHTERILLWLRFFFLVFVLPPFETWEEAEWKALNGRRAQAAAYLRH